MRRASLSVDLHGETFACALRAGAWEHADELTVDATVELDCTSTNGSGPNVLAVFHGRLARASLDAPFLVALDAAEIIVLIVYARSDTDELAHGSTEGTIRIADARWRLDPCRIAATRAPTYAGAQRALVEAHFGLVGDAWMQDWPLEVADEARVDEALTFYEACTDPLLRFDVMQLAIFSSEQGGFQPHDVARLERLLLRDFALHGHTVAEWARLEYEADFPEFKSDAPELVFPISGMMRRVWETSLVPIAVSFD